MIKERRAETVNIDTIETKAFRIPLNKPWGDQTHQISHIELVLVEMATKQGLTGLGFSYTVGFGARAIKALIDWDLSPMLINQEIQPKVLWPRLWRAAHDAGGGGVVTMALAALDIAMWDLVGKDTKKPLVDVLGRHRDGIATYGSGVNLHLSLEELSEQVGCWIEAGYRGAKIKVGKPDLEEDIERVAAVRNLIGPKTALMLDANQGWNFVEAVSRCEAFERFDPRWIEEPLISDDVFGHGELARRTKTPIAIGENVYNIYQFNQYLRVGGCGYVQADVVRVGGITPYLAIASLSDAWNVPMAPHFMMELTGQILCAIPNGYILEDVEGGAFFDLGISASTRPVTNGWYQPPFVPGHGIEFDRAVLESYQIDGPSVPNR